MAFLIILNITGKPSVWEIMRVVWICMFRSRKVLLGKPEKQGF